MTDSRFLIFIVSGTLIGWITGLIFAKISIRGAVGKKREALISQLAVFASSKILSPDLILEKVAKPENFLKLMPVIEDHIDDFLRNRLKTAIPMIGMLIGERTISQLKMVFMQELEVILPEVLNKYIRETSGQFDFKTALEQSLMKIPPADIEKVLNRFTQKLCCVVGAISGLLTGLVNLFTLWLLP